MQMLIFVTGLDRGFVMKVLALLKQCNLYAHQNIEIIDHSNGNCEGEIWTVSFHYPSRCRKFYGVDPYKPIDPPMLDKLLGATINSFNFREDNLIVHVDFD